MRFCLCAQHLLRTHILCQGHKKCFWFCSETFCVRNECFPVCAAWKHSIHFLAPAFARPRNIMCNNVSSFSRAFIPAGGLHSKDSDVHAHMNKNACKLWQYLYKENKSIKLQTFTWKVRLSSKVARQCIIEFNSVYNKIQFSMLCCQHWS